jgi:hypothetical protein
MPWLYTDMRYCSCQQFDNFVCKNWNITDFTANNQPDMCVPLCAVSETKLYTTTVKSRLCFPVPFSLSLATART